MIDARSKQDIADVKNNKDRNTLKTDFFTEPPIFVRKVATKNKEWSPSVHKLGQMILCAFADDIEIMMDTSFGKDKKKSSVKVSGSYVSMLICSC